jgi:molecular chaperone DnaK (HSP70)
VVGRAAKEQAGVTPEQVVSLIKREMGNAEYRRSFFGNEFSAPAISAEIVSALANAVNAEATVPDITGVVITVPAYFGMLERDATRRAGEIAGLNVVGIVPEPVPAALSYGMSGGAGGKTFLVYDLGGGTFDVTLIRMTDDAVEVLATDGDHHLGGADWDQRLLDHLVEQLVEEQGDDSITEDESMLQELRNQAEQTKKNLTRNESKEFNVRASGLTTKVTVTRGQFEEMTSDLLDSTINITERILAEVEQRIPGVREQIGEVLLVGGSSLMPAVKEALKKQFGWEPKLNEPHLSVAKGAALYAAGQIIKVIESGDEHDASADPGTGGATSSRPASDATDDKIRAVSADYGIDEEKLRETSKRSMVNVVSKAVGVKLVDSSRPGWENDADPPFIVNHLIEAQTQLPCSVDFTAGTVVAEQDAVEIEIWEQASPVPSPELSANTQLDAHGKITNLRPYHLAQGSPIEITFKVDDEGSIALTAREPTSGQSLKIDVHISILSDSEVENAKQIHLGMVAST